MRGATQTLERSIDAFHGGGVEAMIEFIHPEFSMTTTPEVASEPDTFEGHDGVRRYFDSFYEAMNEIRIEPESMEENGDRVLMIFDLAARGKTTGIEVKQRAYAIWAVEDGLLISTTFFTSAEDARRALFDD